METYSNSSCLFELHLRLYIVLRDLLHLVPLLSRHDKETGGEPIHYY